MEIILKKADVTAKTRKLSANWTVEPAEQCSMIPDDRKILKYLLSEFGLKTRWFGFETTKSMRKRVQKEFEKKLIKEITAEIDADILREIQRVRKG